MKILEEYFTCPICIEIMNNPITTICGHNFCKDCINLSLINCPICKKTLDFSNLNTNYQLKNIIESIKNFDNQELKNKFFPEIINEEKKKIHELRILISNIFGKDFLCSNYECEEIIKLLTIEILTDNKVFLNEFVNSFLINKENLNSNYDNSKDKGKKI